MTLLIFFAGIPNGTNISITPSQNGQNGQNDEDGEVMNNLMSDIQNGFVHRRLPDGGFKVLEVTCFCLALSKSVHSTLEVKLEGVKVSVEYFYNSENLVFTACILLPLAAFFICEWNFMKLF